MPRNEGCGSLADVLWVFVPRSVEATHASKEVGGGDSIESS